jgi:nucleotide-binding universal stress UspA family protein
VIGTVVPLEAAPPNGPIVLGTDFGPASRAAEQVAIRAARDERRDLVIVNAIDPGRLRLPGGLWRRRIDEVRAERELAAAALIARARAAGVPARVLIWTGDAASCVLDAAAAEGADRIVVGSHGRGRIARAIAGSVSTDVRGKAGCTVEVVPADPQRAESA